ncbi:MAG: hypothetical protein RLZZ241_1574 [Bacteroidota bacterium]|jgi:cystathionine beta-lyase
MSDKLSFETRVIHGGQQPDPAYGAVMPPVYFSVTYAQEEPGLNKGYAYSRSANPTRSALESALASIENGSYGFAFSSGLSALDAVLKLLKPGDEVLASQDLYGGTYRLFKQVYEPMGIRFRFENLANPNAVTVHSNTNTRLIWIETPTNPTLQLLDIPGIVKKAAKVGAMVAVDNTFATPYLQRPLELGADIVMHSATKYLGGHSDVVAGALVVRDANLAKQIKFIQNACGAILGPMDSYLVLRGIKTLHVRMQRHCDNARQLAEYLANHPDVEKVYWPGLVSHSGHELAARQMLDFGGMLSFVPRDTDYEGAVKLVRALKLFTLAESLGGVESLVGHPASMTHASVPKAERLKSGITDTLIRLSAGIESAADLISDLESGLLAMRA